MLKFILVGERLSTNSLQQDFDDLISQLATFSDIGLLRNNSRQVTISYTGMPMQATLEIPDYKLQENSDLLPPQQMILTCQKDDHLGLNLIRNVVGSIGFRVINPILGCFLPQDNQLIDVTTMELGPNLAWIFKKAGLKPLFNFQNSLTYYAQSLKDGSIHLINRHLLEYLLNSPQIKKIPADFSLMVAPDISRFIALQDRGLIPISFYKYYHNPTKIINLSGFNVEKLESDALITPIFFKFNPTKQQFVSQQLTDRTDEIKVGYSLLQYFDQLLEYLRIKSGYLAAKVAMDVDYGKGKNNKLLPRLTVSIFLDK